MSMCTCTAESARTHTGTCWCRHRHTNTHRHPALLIVLHALRLVDGLVATAHLQVGGMVQVVLDHELIVAQLELRQTWNALRTTATVTWCSDRGAGHACSFLGRQGRHATASAE
jgi:hypothetical protein